MNFDERGIRIPRYDQLLVMSKCGPGRPKKLDTTELDKIALSRSANGFPLFQQKRGRGRPRKNPVESENQAPNKHAATLLSLQKRGRGRPRKNPVESENQAPNKLAATLLSLQKRGRGRPRKNPIEQQTQSKPAGDFLIQKRGRGRPRKNPVESEIQINLKENYISDVKVKLKLLETITNGYREIERIDKETQKNVKKLCSMTHNSK